jgi:uncharacterized membrane protein
MSMLLLGLALFLGVHSVSIVAPAWRDAMAARLGAGAWKGLYSLVSLAGFVLLLKGYALARLEPSLVWVPPTGLRHVAALLMLPVFPLLFAAYLPGRIRDAAKHPMLAAVKFWALAHLLANGMLADIVLFGSLLVWAVLDRISMKRRAPRATPAAPPKPYNDVLAILLGLTVYALFVMGAHQMLFGVAPFG